MSGLFATFNVGKRGLFAQQQAINTTSHNIANANTEGYSRQRATMETTRPFGMPSMDNQVGPGQIGTGVEVSAIQRIRDEFMDYQVRNEKSTLGKYEARDKYISEIENIFNEPSDTGISTLIGKFFNAWDQLSKQADSSNARTIVATQSSALANELNHTYNQLQSVRDNAHASIKQSVFDVNALLDRVDKLNQQIISVKVSGMEPNDLMDNRDLLLDELSTKFNINIDKKNFNAFDVSPIQGDLAGLPDGAEKLLVRKEPNSRVSRFSYINSIEPKDKVNSDYSEMTISYFKNGDLNAPGNNIKIDLSGITNADPVVQKANQKNIFKQIEKYIDECRVMWAEEDGKSYADGITINFNNIKDASGNIDFKKLEKELGLFHPSGGELQGYMSVQEDADNYIDQINKMAKALALAVNTVHSGVHGNYSSLSAADTLDSLKAANIDQTTGKLTGAIDFMPFFVNKDIESDPSKSFGELLRAEEEINAGNIAINEEILKDVMKIKTRLNDDLYAYESGNVMDGETDGKRALAIAELRDMLVKIQDVDRGGITTRQSFIASLTGGQLLKQGTGVKTIQNNINGTKIDNYFKDTINKVGIQGQEAKRIVKNQEVLLAGFQQRRDSISGVSLDEEMANLIQYQHAYQANAKIINTVDELLDVVVNGLKR